MPGTNDMRKSVNRQIGELQEQIHSLRSSLAGQGSELYDAADERAHAAMKQVKRQAAYLGNVARENPASAATVLSVTALVCLGLGYLAGRARSDDW